MARGTVEPISTTARPWGLLPARNVVSIRSLRAGALFPALRSRRARSGDAIRRGVSGPAGDDLVLLLTPPFDKTPLDPGYIKGYPPGVRENGGQYTHAAMWYAIAFAMQGDGDKAGELFRMLNPINRTSTRGWCPRVQSRALRAGRRHLLEPPHVGRGGWSWYTGAAGWMYRAGMEWILGLRKRGAALQIDPCIPRAWKGFEIAFRYHGSRYEITVENPRGVSRGIAQIEVDGRILGSGSTSLPLNGGWRDASSARHPGVHGCSGALRRTDRAHRDPKGRRCSAVFRGGPR